MKIFDKILLHEVFADQPPVLLDIGSSTHLCERWNQLAKYSICIAFDPDARQMDYISAMAGNYRKLHVIPAIVHPELDGECDFYLASSPECSSMIELRSQEVKKWHFQYFFQLEKKVKLPCVTLSGILSDLKLNYVDCFKADTQGTDLRILNSLGENRIARILSLELEPGPSAAYVNDDTLGSVISDMEQRHNFRMIACRPLGSQYFPLELEEKYLSKLQRRLIPTVLRESPLWFELSYLNNFNKGGLGKREYLLGWVLAMIETEYGWASELAEMGKAKFNDQIFEEMQHATLKAIPWIRPTLMKIIRKISLMSRFKDA